VRGRTFTGAPCRYSNPGQPYICSATLMSYAAFLMSYATFIMSYAAFIMSYAAFIMSYATFIMSYAAFIMSYVKAHTISYAAPCTLCEYVAPKISNEITIFVRLYFYSNLNSLQKNVL
jgi:hypothetical protein